MVFGVCDAPKMSFSLHKPVCVIRVESHRCIMDLDCLVIDYFKLGWGNQMKPHHGYYSIFLNALCIWQLEREFTQK